MKFRNTERDRWQQGEKEYIKKRSEDKCADGIIQIFI